MTNRFIRIFTLLIICILSLFLAGCSKTDTAQNGGTLSGSAPNSAKEDGFSAGTVENGKYTNRWADISFTVSDTFPEGDDSVYEMFTTDTTVCGFASLNTVVGRQLVISFSDVSAAGFTSGDMYLDVVLSEFATGDIDATVSDYFTCNIAGKKFDAFKLNIEDNGLIEYCLAYIQNGYVISILVASTDEAEITEFLDSVKKA